MNDNTEREHCGGVNCPFEYSCVDSCMYPKTEEYCRECQHPHVNERLRKEVAELRKENERWREGFEGLTREIKKMQEDHSTTREGWKMHYDSQAEAIKRLTAELKFHHDNIDIARGTIELEYSETIKRLTEALKEIYQLAKFHSMEYNKIWKIAESALSGTKETE